MAKWIISLGSYVRADAVVLRRTVYALGWAAEIPSFGGGDTSSPFFRRGRAFLGGSWVNLSEPGSYGKKVRP